MKKVIIASAMFSIVGTASFACSVDESRALSNSISEVVTEVVALDDANLGKVMGLMQTAAVKEYHDGPFETVCARQYHLLDMVTDLSETLTSEQSAMLQQ